MYIFGTTTPQGAWNLIGIALRFCEEVGVHRRNGAAKTALTEQWKRVFWWVYCLFYLISQHVDPTLAGAWSYWTE